MTLDDLKRQLAKDKNRKDRDALLALAVVSPLTISAAWRAWERSAPLALQGILTGNGWRWDSLIQGYRSTTTGQVVSGQKLKALALKISDAIREGMRKEAALLGVGLPSDVFKHAFGLQVAGAFLVMGALAAGGFDNLTTAIQREIMGGERKPGGLKYSLGRLARWGGGEARSG